MMLGSRTLQRDKAIRSISWGQNTGQKKKGDGMNGKDIILGSLVGILTIGVAGSVTLSALTFSEIRSMKSGVGLESGTEQDLAAEDSLTSEDNVLIAENYKIESTLPISDAYKSGDSSKLSDKEKETLELASKVLGEIITDGMGDYEKERAVYDWMAKEISTDSGILPVIPTSSQEGASPYGALKYHNAVCVGYATTFRLFMQMLDIECKVIHNKDMYHSWDLVKLDGHWYHVDVYSDAGVGNYANFNSNDYIQSMQQEWDKDYFPASDSLEYNYAYQNRKSAKSIYDIPKILRKALNDKNSSLVIEFENTIAEADMEKAATLVSYIDNLLMSNESQTLGMLLNYNWIQEPGTDRYMYWITTSVNPAANPQADLSQEEIDKMQKAIADSFEDIGYVDLNGYVGGDLQPKEAAGAVPKEDAGVVPEEGDKAGNAKN